MHFLHILLLILLGTFIRAFWAILLAMLIYLLERFVSSLPHAISHSLSILACAIRLTLVPLDFFLGITRSHTDKLLKLLEIVFALVISMLHMILLECPLELVPPEISALKQVQRTASRRGKKPQEILLDQAIHGKAMLRLDEHERRGRPDIIHFSLMALMETPLCKSGLLRTHVHLQDGRIIEIDPSVRLPRSYSRFVGLFEQLLINGRVPPTGEPLLLIQNESIRELIKKIGPNHSHPLTILTLESGQRTDMKQLISLLPEDDATPVIVGVGAFPHGDFSDEIKQLFDTHIALDSDVMMAWHVCSEIIWSYSLKTNIISKRFALD